MANCSVGCVTLANADHLSHLKALEPRSGLAQELNHPYTDMKCPDGSGVASMCIAKGYPKSTPQHIVFNEDTY